MDKEPPKYLLITRHQLQEGYHERLGVMVYQRGYQIIKQHHDGTILVLNPEWRQWKKENPK